MDDEEKNAVKPQDGDNVYQTPVLAGSPEVKDRDEVTPWGPLWSLAWTFCILSVWAIAQFILLGIMKFFVEIPVGADGEPTTTLPEMLMADGDLMGIMAFGSAVAGCLMILAVVRARGTSFSRGLGLRLPKAWVWPVVLVVTPILLVVLSMAVAPFAQDKSIEDQGKIALAVRATQWLPLLLLGVAVGAPFFEEFLFRGILHEGLKQSFLGKWGAGILTALAFSAMHMQYQDPSAFVLLFLLGCAFTIGRELTGSIYVPILMHAIQNSIATIPLWLALNGHIPADEIPAEMREVLEYTGEAAEVVEPVPAPIVPSSPPPGIGFPLAR